MDVVEPAGAQEAIAVQVACAFPEQQYVWDLQVNRGITIGEVLTLPALVQQVTAAGLVPDAIDLAHCAVGIFGEVVSRERIVDNGERIELYRPLQIDPKTSRRLRADAARQRRR